MRARSRQSKGSYLCIGISIFLFYFIFLKKRIYTEKFELEVETYSPKVVWEYIADFSNFQKINPTIEEFEIEYEKGNYENWEYGIKYLEHFTIIPFFKNYNRGMYQVIPEKKIGHNLEPFTILSEHTSCILFFCLDTKAEMTFEKGLKKSSTKIIEIINFECSPLLAFLCRREVRKQRLIIYDQIKSSDMSQMSQY